MTQTTDKAKQGFTLVELAIVLVIIGLIIGGVLVGKDMIDVAAIRAQISQIDKFNAAANTFFLKYGYLPGDIPDPEASRFGFAARTGAEGQGDGNGLIEPWMGYTLDAHAQCSGEGPMFWVDLSAAKLIEGSFTTATISTCPSSTVSGRQFDQWFPRAKLGANYITAGYNDPQLNSGQYFHRFGIVAPVSMPFQSDLLTNSGLTVMQAYRIDQKIDDGSPTTGKVLAGGTCCSSVWATGGTTAVYAWSNPTGTSTTCFDQSTGSAGYSIEVSGGTGMNCVLMIQMQAGN
jgi:prepilin-type N-terminal cleavage/methylation domain-containing protein